MLAVQHVAERAAVVRRVFHLDRMIIVDVGLFVVDAMVLQRVVQFEEAEVYW